MLHGWDSLTIVRRFHSLLEGVALVCFAGLVVADIVAHFVKDNHERTAKTLERIGLVFFAIAIIGELIGYSFGRRTEFLADEQDRNRAIQIRDIERNLERARTDVNTLRRQAKQAVHDSGLAVTQSKSSRIEAEQSRNLAHLAEIAA